MPLKRTLFVRCVPPVVSYLLPEKSHSSKQKSLVVRRNCNPTWNHTFVFENVSYEDLRERSLELTIWDYDRLVSNDFLGGVRLNLGTGQSVGRSVGRSSVVSERVRPRGRGISSFLSVDRSLGRLKLITTPEVLWRESVACWCIGLRLEPFVF